MPTIGFPRGGRRTPRISLALQGGGAHGAFTWGVLDRLLEAGVTIDAVSGTSAGACNAVALAHGWAQGGGEGARETLAKLWRGVADTAEQAGLPRGELGAFALSLASHLFSPYELNPAGIDPLRELLEELVDFERLRRARPFKLLIAATNLRTGKGRVFQEHELTVECVLASAALPPQLHRSVEIAGELYWDGGYTSNPPVVALAERSRVRDIVIVRINPVESEAVPKSASAIRNRTAEIVFGHPLQVELERLQHARDLARGPAGWLSPALRRLARVQIDTISCDETLGRLDPSTRVLPQWPVLQQLRDAGRDAAEGFLARAMRPYARPDLDAAPPT
jgi:NTE family protein